LKKLIFPLLILILPVFSHASDTTLTNDSISWKSAISLESNSLNMDFANRMLFGGYINESQKNSWISKLDDNNTIFSEVSNTLSFHRNFGDNSFFFSIILPVSLEISKSLLIHVNFFHFIFIDVVEF
jgi:hypothetical protein